MQAEEHKMEEGERGAALYTVFNLYTATYLYSKVTEIRGGGGRGEERERGGRGEERERGGRGKERRGEEGRGEGREREG